MTPLDKSIKRVEKELQEIERSIASGEKQEKELIIRLWKLRVRRVDAVFAGGCR